MAKARGADPYRRLLRGMAVVLALTVLFGTGYVLLDKYQQGEHEREARRIQEENEQLNAQYERAIAELRDSLSQADQSLDKPEPAKEGLDVLDLSDVPIAQDRTVEVTREEMLMGGLLLLNRWHELPGDFFQVEPEIKSVMTETNLRVPVTSNRVLLFPAAIAALDAFVRDAKEEGLENYIIREGFRSMESQTEKWNNEVSKHTSRYSGDGLIEKARQNVAYPGTSDFQSGFSFTVDVYSRDDSTLNAAAFQTTPQSDWLNENAWKYGLIFRFPIQGYPRADTVDKAYKTGIDLKLDVYRYVGIPHATAMKALGLCLEEYIEHLIERPHIGIYEDGKLLYEVFRLENIYSDLQVGIPRNAREVALSTDNMGGLICALSY